MSNRRHIRIFISSPGDVQKERQIARSVIERLSRDPFVRKKADVEALMWDDPDAPIPMDATMPPQEAVNLSIDKPSECEIVVVIFWSRMGTPLSPEIRKPDGSPYYSGTEWEYLDAVQAAETSADKLPYVPLYRRDATPPFNTDAPENASRLEQWQRVQAFFAAFTNPDGSLERGVNTYKTPEAFGELLESHLRVFIQRILEKERSPIPTPSLLALLFVVVLALAAVYGLTSGGDGRGVPTTIAVTPTEFVMDGDFNIAVAGLALPANSTEEAAQAFTYVHQNIYQSLINEYMNSGVQVERQRYGTVEIEREAEILAQTMNADLVIYANVEAFGDTYRYTPRFVLAARQDSEMGEIVGDHTWLQETLTHDSLNALANNGSMESARLRLKSTILTEFTQAIVNLSSGDPVGARDPIARAVSAAETFRERYSEDIPIGVIYLFASTIYRMNGDLEPAERYAELAAENPNYGRARLALGHVQYVRAINAYYDENDRASAFNYLNMARQHYLDTLALTNQPLSALVAEKAYISLGNAYQVLYQIVDANTKPRFLSDAIEAYQNALRRLSAIRSEWLQPSVLDWSSEAERQLGSMYDVAGLTTEAAAAYARAIELSEDPAFESLVQATLDSLSLPASATSTP